MGKNLARGNTYGATVPCQAKNCMCCEQTTGQETFEINGKVVKSAPGSCATYNVMYLVTSKIPGYAG